MDFSRTEPPKPQQHDQILKRKLFSLFHIDALPGPSVNRMGARRPTAHLAQCLPSFVYGTLHQISP
eukprot:7657984-Pyramimonas_sp.AAC.2